MKPVAKGLPGMPEDLKRVNVPSLRLQWRVL